MSNLKEVTGFIEQLAERVQGFKHRVKQACGGVFIRGLLLNHYGKGWFEEKDFWDEFRSFIYDGLRTENPEEHLSIIDSEVFGNGAKYISDISWDELSLDGMRLLVELFIHHKMKPGASMEESGDGELSKDYRVQKYIVHLLDKDVESEEKADLLDVWYSRYGDEFSTFDKFIGFIIFMINVYGWRVHSEMMSNLRSDSVLLIGKWINDYKVHFVAKVRERLRGLISNPDNSLMLKTTHEPLLMYFNIATDDYIFELFSEYWNEDCKELDKIILKTLVPKPSKGDVGGVVKDVSKEVECSMYLTKSLRDTVLKVATESEYFLNQLESVVGRDWFTDEWFWNDFDSRGVEYILKKYGDDLGHKYYPFTHLTHFDWGWESYPLDWLVRELLENYFDTTATHSIVNSLTFLVKISDLVNKYNKDVDTTREINLQDLLEWAYSWYQCGLDKLAGMINVDVDFLNTILNTYVQQLDGERGMKEFDRAWADIKPQHQEQVKLSMEEALRRLDIEPMEKKCFSDILTRVQDILTQDSKNKGIIIEEGKIISGFISKLVGLVNEIQCDGFAPDVAGAIIQWASKWYATDIVMLAKTVDVDPGFLDRMIDEYCNQAGLDNYVMALRKAWDKYKGKELCTETDFQKMLKKIEVMKHNDKMSEKAIKRLVLNNISTLDEMKTTGKIWVADLLNYGKEKEQLTWDDGVPLPDVVEYEEDKNEDIDTEYSPIIQKI